MQCAINWKVITDKKYLEDLTAFLKNLNYVIQLVITQKLIMIKAREVICVIQNNFQADLELNRKGDLALYIFFYIALESRAMSTLG